MTDTDPTTPNLKLYEEVWTGKLKKRDSKIVENNRGKRDIDNANYERGQKTNCSGRSKN